MGGGISARGRGTLCRLGLTVGNDGSVGRTAPHDLTLGFDVDRQCGDLLLRCVMSLQRPYRLVGLCVLRHEILHQLAGEKGAYPGVPDDDRAIGVSRPHVQTRGLIGEGQHALAVAEALEDLTFQVIGNDLLVIGTRPHLLAHSKGHHRM